VAKVCNGCSWSPLSGDFNNNDFVVWSFDNGGSTGIGPVTLTLATGISGFGAVVQADSPGQFTAKIELFNSSNTSLGFVTRTSNAAGDAMFIGALDVTAPNATKAVFSLTAAQSNSTPNFLGDFATGALALNVPVVVGAPALTITKSHVGTFTQGQTGATYTITVTNSGTAPTTAAVSVSDTVPAGLTATSISGTNWVCTPPAGPCTNSTVEAASASFPALTLTVNVAANAAATVTNSATVTGGGAAAGATANDPTTINASGAPALTITKTHIGNFTQGQIGATYTITVTNSGTAATTAAVSVSDTVPAGLTATSISGTNWVCTPPAGPCTNSTIEAASASFPALTLTVNVAANAAATVTNSATVTGGGAAAGATANDPTTITPVTTPALTDIFQVRYAANLNIGDAYVDITNSGASGGNICANVYTFDPAEELISCCTCSVTPNGLQSLSVVKSLISNPLTPAVPTAAVIKIVSTSGACNAAVIDPANFAPGMLAWGTSLHSASTSSASYSVTETPFSKAVLTAPELSHITSTCGFIQSNGSGFGICKGCAAGGLGATPSAQ